MAASAPGPDFPSTPHDHPEVTMAPRASRRRAPSPTSDVPDCGGQVVPLLAGVVVLVGAMLLGLVDLGVTALDAARADTAADAAALSGATGGAPAADRAARSNGAALVRFEQDDDGVTVHAVVRLGRATADARARLVGVDAPPPTTTARPGDEADVEP